MVQLKGKVAVITGGSRGIGAATAKRLARAGAAVAVNYFQSETAAGEVVAAIRGIGGTAIAVQADVRDALQCEAMAAEVREKLGPVDVLVLNASISFPVTPFLKFPWPEFEAKLTGELKSAFFCCKAFVPGMVERRKGSVIAISSGLSRHPGEGFCAHSTAKSGLDAFVKSLALELGPSGVTVNVVAPGMVKTAMTAGLPDAVLERARGETALHELGEPEDVAEAIDFFCRAGSRHITGTVLRVDGGQALAAEGA